jgi:hypothetical protein
MGQSDSMIKSCCAKILMMQYFPSIFALAILSGTSGCEQKKGISVIEVADEDLTIERDGRSIVEIRPYMNGTSIKILSADGDWIQVSPTSPTGKFEDSVFMERREPDGTTFLLQVLPDGTAINRTEFPIGTWPGDDGYDETPKAEQGGPPQSATRSESDSEGDDNPQPESESRPR